MLTDFGHATAWTASACQIALGTVCGQGTRWLFRRGDRPLKGIYPCNPCARLESRLINWCYSCFSTMRLSLARVSSMIDECGNMRLKNVHVEPVNSQVVGSSERCDCARRPKRGNARKVPVGGEAAAGRQGAQSQDGRLGPAPL